MATPTVNDYTPPELTRYPDVPIDVNLANVFGTAQFFLTTFGQNIVVSSVSTILLLILVFVVLYLLQQLRRKIIVDLKVKRYRRTMPTAAATSTFTSHSPNSSAPPTRQFMTGAMGGQPLSATTTVQRIGGQQSTTHRFNVEFQAAGIGYAADGTPYHQQDGYHAASNNYSVMTVPGQAGGGMSASLLMDFAEDFKLKGKLAEGGGGVVYKADLLNKDVVARFDTTMAVVKVLKPLPHMAFSELKKVVFQEIAIMQALAHHSNVITLIGYTEEPLSIITRLYDRNLFNVIMAYPEYATSEADYVALKQFVKTDSKLRKGLIVKGFELLPELALHFAWGVAAGMAEMHKAGILHRDLKSANVLVELKNFQGGSAWADKPAWMNDPKMATMAKKISGMFGQNSLAGGVGWGNGPNGKPVCPINPVVCDFGLAKRIKRNGQYEEVVPELANISDEGAVGISYKYAAPEAFNRMQHRGAIADESKPVDVYAFAVIVWEMLERKIPFHKVNNKDIEAKVRAGERPPISAKYMDAMKPYDNNKHFSVLVKMIEACWKQDPRERPSFTEVKEKLRPFWLGAKDPQDWPQEAAKLQSQQQSPTATQQHIPDQF